MNYYWVLTPGKGTVALIKAKSDDEAKQIAVKTYGVDAYVKPNWSVSYGSVASSRTHGSDWGWY